MVVSRCTRHMDAPASAKAIAIAAPMPLVAPVHSAVCPARENKEGAGAEEGGGADVIWGCRGSNQAELGPVTAETIVLRIIDYIRL